MMSEELSDYQQLGKFFHKELSEVIKKKGLSSDINVMELVGFNSTYNPTIIVMYIKFCLKCEALLPSTFFMNKIINNLVLEDDELNFDESIKNLNPNFKGGYKPKDHAAVISAANNNGIPVPIEKTTSKPFVKGNGPIRMPTMKHYPIIPQKQTKSTNMNNIKFVDVDDAYKNFKNHAIAESFVMEEFEISYHSLMHSIMQKRKEVLELRK